MITLISDMLVWRFVFECQGIYTNLYIITILSYLWQKKKKLLKSRINIRFIIPSGTLEDYKNYLEITLGNSMNEISVEITH